MATTLERKVFKYGVKPSRRQETLKKTLLGGVSVAITAAMLGMSGVAMAAELEIVGAALTPDAGGADVIVNKIDDADAATLDINGNKTVDSIDIDLDGTLTVHDSAATAEKLTVTNNIDVASGKTFTVQFGATTETVGATLEVTKALAEAAGTATGGTIKFISMVNDSATPPDGTATILGNVDMTKITVEAAAGGTQTGSAMTANFGTDANNTFKVDTLEVIGGAADPDKTGGAAAAVINGTATIGATGIKVEGGDGEAAATSIGGAASLTFNEAVTSSGDITITAGAGGADGAAIGGNSTIIFTKDITATGKKLTITGGNAESGANGGEAKATIKGNAIFDSITLTSGTGSSGTPGKALLDIDGAAAKAITGAISGTGKIQISNATTDKLITFNSAIDVGAVDLSTAEVKFEKSVKTGTLGITGGGKITVGDSFKAGDTVITASGTANIAGTTTVILPATFTSGDINLIDGHTDFVASTEKTKFTAEAPLMKYTFAADSSDATILKVTAALTDDAVKAGATAADSQVFQYMNLIDSSKGKGQLKNLTTADMVKAAKTTKAQVNIASAATAVSTMATMHTLKAVNSRLSFARAGTSGFAAGDDGMASNTWIKTFGNWTSQDKKGGIDGYDVDTYGFAVGVDTEVQKDIRAGIAFSYANADVDGDGDANSNAEVDNYRITLYGDYTTDKYYLEGMIGYARADNELSYTGSFDKVTKNADYDSDQYMISVGGGMPIDMGGDMFVTPFGSLTWTHLESDSYTETGTGNYNLKVNMDDVDSFIAEAGAKIHKKIKKNDGFIIPSASASISYDFADEEASMTSSFTNLTNINLPGQTGIENEEFTGKIGLGIAYEVGQWSIGANYEGQFKSGYDSHGAMLKANYKF